MRILIDLGHPAHIHYFKNFVKIMKAKGHEFAIVARDKEVLHSLLNHYNFQYISRGKGRNSLIGKLFYILYADYIIYKVALRFKPDLFLSFSSTYAAHVSKLVGKPHIAFDDTEHAKLELLMYTPFSDVIINPKCYWKKFSNKQIFIDTFFELCYLHPKYFKTDLNILRQYNIFPNEVFFVLRFVSWNASHDIGAKGISNEMKLTLVKKLETKGKVLISAEGSLPEELEKYRLKINPIHLHDILSQCSLYVGEGATTASECVALGVPAVYVNSLNAGTLQEQSDEYGLISVRTSEDLERIFDNCVENISENKEKMVKLKSKLLQNKIDGTAFLVWFIENYPESKQIMKKNPDYQYKFR